LQVCGGWNDPEILLLEARGQGREGLDHVFLFLGPSGEPFTQKWSRTAE